MKKYTLPALSKTPPKVAEVSSPYPYSGVTVPKGLTFAGFRKISDKAPFTIATWAEILHISERTLHRYAKEQSGFNPLQSELIMHVKKLIDAGNALFGPEGFKSWLETPVFSLQHRAPKELLTSYAGIQELINLIGRLQHGISA